ncbi:MAG: radical SAM protein [Proteobacteria bacterium]|nr:radical SAM protein [Pseudomonadota bacterium]
MASSHKRFVGRKEYFGSLIYDRERGDYIPFDWDATFIFEESLKHPIDTVFKNMDGRLTQQSFQTFVQLCQSIDLLDASGRFTGEMLPTTPAMNIISAPLRVHLTVTQECQLRCRHCSQKSRDAAPGELSLEELQRLFDDMAASGVCEVTIAGGEPFMRPDIVNIVTYARQKGLSVNLSTTGLFVSRVTAKKLAEVGLKSIRVSFDGSTEKSYDYFRGKKGAYRRAMRGIKALREIFEKTPITIHTTIMKQNQTELLTLARMVQKLKCDTWSVDYVKPQGFAAQDPRMMLSKAEAETVFKAITRIAENSSVRIEMAHFPYRTQRKVIYRGFGCVGANLYCYVSSQGNVAPCSFTMDYFPAGNVKQQSIKEIWQTAEAFKKFRGFPGNETCHKCDYFSSCRGGCRIRAIMATQSGSAIDPNCFVMPEPAAAPGGMSYR